MFSKTLPRYIDGYGPEYLQLHDNHTMWELDNDKLTEQESEWLYTDLVNSAVEEFESTTKIEVYLLGRSGRHVCVNDTPKNSKNYRRLKRIALRLEKEVIEGFNSYISEGE